MLRIALFVVAIALAGTASAAGWRSLRMDASSQESFEKSVAEFQDKLTKSRRHAFERALQEIWIQGTRAAEAEQREYTNSDYFRQLEGLSYDEVVRVIDPTGEAAQRLRAEYYYARSRGLNQAPTNPSWPSNNPPPTGWNGQGFRGGTYVDRLPPAMQSLLGY